MAQKLIQPINDLYLTASYKNASYKSSFGFTHYGVDCRSERRKTTVYASGNGTVLAAGYDSVFGNILVIRYPEAYNRATGKYADGIVRYFHFASTCVTKGQAVTKDTVIGQYGNTGQYSVGAHLHFECDTDTRYPLWTPSLSGKSTFFTGSSYGAGDAAMSNPLDWIYCKFSSPDNQTYTTAGDRYINAADKSIARLE